MEITIKGNVINFDGEEYIRTNSEPFEIITVEEVRPHYQKDFKWLSLGFEMPQMQFRPGDRIKIIKV